MGISRLDRVGPAGGNGDGGSVLVGRAREQEALRACLAAAVRGHGCMVLVGGEVSIDKTTPAVAAGGRPPDAEGRDG